MKTLVIAEVGSTHDGSYASMETLVETAAWVGADVCKFQWTSSPERLTARRQAPEYLEAYRLIAFPREWLPRLAARCAEAGVEFMCTVYLPEDVSAIAPFVKRFKVASFEAADWHFLGLHAEFGRQVIVSAGMQEAGVFASMARRYVRLLDQPPVLWSVAIAFLHCVSAYPCPNEEINLGVLRRNAWDEGPGFVGLSDHTRHPWTGALAVAVGAEIVEFHVRLDDTDPANADYAVSRSPKEAREYVRNIRVAEAMLGDGVKRVMPCEAPMLRYRVPVPRPGDDWAQSAPEARL